MHVPMGMRDISDRAAGENIAQEAFLFAVRASALLPCVAKQHLAGKGVPYRVTNTGRTVASGGILQLCEMSATLKISVAQTAAPQISVSSRQKPERRELTRRSRSSFRN
jgi:hypothetical protein